MLLLNPAHVKGLAGRKTDRRDAIWLATRLEREDLKGSFVPPPPVRELRDMTRMRVHLLQDLNRVKNRIGDICETGNIKVSSVASDLFGVSGRRMLDAVVEGKRDAGWMADYARGTLRGKREQLELALQGTFTTHQRHMLGRLVNQMKGDEAEITDLTAEIDRRTEDLQDQIVRLCTIPGIDRIAAWTILGETGWDMTVFADARHLASWGGLCPGNRESGGKSMSGRTRKGNMYLRRILCQCAWAASHQKDSHLAALYHRVRSRRGHQKAIMAVAHQMLVIVFHILGSKDVYRELGADYHEQRDKPKAADKLVRRLQKLGFYVTLQPIPEDPPPPLTPASEPLVTTIRKRGRPCKCLQRGLVCTHRINSETIPLPNM
jgi:transposase